MIDCMGCEYAPMDISDADKPCTACKATSSGLKSVADVKELARDQAYSESKNKKEEVNRLRRKAQMEELKKIYSYDEVVEMLQEFVSFNPDGLEDGCPLRYIPYDCPYGKSDMRKDAEQFFKNYGYTYRESWERFEQRYNKYNSEWIEKRTKAILKKWEKAFDNLPIRQKGEEE